MALTCRGCREALQGGPSLSCPCAQPPGRQGQWAARPPCGLLGRGWTGLLDPGRRSRVGDPPRALLPAGPCAGRSVCQAASHSVPAPGRPVQPSPPHSRAGAHRHQGPEPALPAPTAAQPHPPPRTRARHLEHRAAGLALCRGAGPTPLPITSQGPVPGTQSGWVRLMARVQPHSA